MTGYTGNQIRKEDTYRTKLVTRYKGYQTGNKIHRDPDRYVFILPNFHSKGVMLKILTTLVTAFPYKIRQVTYLAGN